MTKINLTAEDLCALLDISVKNDNMLNGIKLVKEWAMSVDQELKELKKEEKSDDTNTG